MSNIVKKAIGVLKSPKKRTIILAQHGFFKNMSDEDFLSFYRKVNAVNYFYYETYKTSFKKCSHLWKNITILNIL